MLKKMKFLKYTTPKKILIFIFLNFLSTFAEVITIASIIPFILIVFDENKKRLILENFNFLPENIFDNFYLITFIYLIIIIISYFIKYFSLIYTTKLSNEITHEVRVKIFSNSIFENYQKILNLNQNKILSLISIKINDFTSYISSYLQLISSLFTSVVIIVYLSVIEVKIIILTLIFFSIYFLVIFYKNKNILFNNGKIISNSQNEIIRVYKNIFGFFEEITVYNLKNKINNLFINSSELISKKYQKNYIIGNLPRIQIEYISIILAIFFLIFMKNQNFDIVSNIAILATFGFSAQKLLPLINKIFNNLSQIKSSSPIYKEFINFLENLKNKNEIVEKNFKEIKFNNSFEIKNIKFKYKKSKNNIIKNLNLKIKKGSVTSIYGKSGSGKSTLGKIILGLLPEIDSKIIVDEKKVISKKLIPSWQRKLSYVSQNTFIFDGTIKENITLFSNKNNINYNLLKKCCKISMIDNFSKNLSNGLNTYLQNNGSILSGGQKQRIGIARALYKNSEILILDEPTSALDKNMEKKLVKNLLKLDKTLIFFSHSSLIKSISHKNIKL
jgi:ABC-type multidrug transport system fused ATPase/permease subunit